MPLADARADGRDRGGGAGWPRAPADAAARLLRELPGTRAPLHARRRDAALVGRDAGPARAASGCSTAAARAARSTWRRRRSRQARGAGEQLGGEPLAQPRARDLRAAADRCACRLGQDHGAGQQRRGPPLADAVPARHLDRRAARSAGRSTSSSACPLQRLPPTIFAQRAGAAAHRQAGVGGRRRLDARRTARGTSAARGLDACAGRARLPPDSGWSAAASRCRPTPAIGATPYGRSRRRARSNRRRRRRRRSRRARSAQRRRRHPDTRSRPSSSADSTRGAAPVARCSATSRSSALTALAARRGDDHSSSPQRSARAPASANSRARVGGLLHLLGGDPAMPLDRRRQADLRRAPAAIGATPPARGLGDQQPHRVRSDVDDADPHHP